MRIKKVLKFGGSSVAGAGQIRKVVQIVKSQQLPCVVVVSALGGVTDQLKSLASLALDGTYEELISEISQRHEAVINELLSSEHHLRALDYCRQRTEELKVICQGIHMLRELSDRSMARLMSYGELVSSSILAEAIHIESIPCERIDARSLIRTDHQLMKANVNFTVSEAQIKAALKDCTSVVVIPGFIAATSDNMTSTLGRGGSDYTASILAAALDVEELEIWSDVNGMLSANPKSVPQAKTIPHLSYNEAFELSHFGAKVLYPPAVQPVYEKAIPILLKNTFLPDETGTEIRNKVTTGEAFIAGISSLDEVAMVNITGIGMVGVPGYSSRVFSALYQHRINVVLIAQSCSERGICIAVDRADLDVAARVLSTTFTGEIETRKIEPIKVEENLSIIALVGDKMKYRSGVSGRIFSVLGYYGINIRAIAQGSSESNISIVLDSVDENKALQVLHETFFEKKPIVIHLFVVGVGTVGKAFIRLLRKFGDEILIKNNYKIKVCALVNSRKMMLDESGLSLDDIEARLETTSTTSDLEELVHFANALAVPNKVLVDNTASNLTAPHYLSALKSKMHVVTCNKIVASGNADYFSELKRISDSGWARYYYETNVGAALPILHTLDDMRRSGDKISRIQAVLSGSLGFIYDQYDGSRPFCEVVQEALDLGYTEPNPYIDLSGLDVKRKLVILARTAGFSVDIDDVKSQEDLPEGLHDGLSVGEVMSALKDEEAHFQSMLSSANKENKKLMFIGELNQGQLEIGLQAVGPDHFFYSLSGTDNMVAIYSDRYDASPLIIRGAGAGPDLTASGVLSDVLRINFVS